jgi:hypothetical protein
MQFNIASFTQTLKTACLASLLCMLAAWSAPVFGQANAQVQFLHNSADSAANTVDLRIRAQPGGIADSLVADDWDFSTGTGFLNIPAGVPFEIYVCDSNSSSINDSLAAPLNISGLNGGDDYVVSLQGVVNEAQFSYTLFAQAIGASTNNITTSAPLELEVRSGAKASAQSSGQVEVQFLHTAPDLPDVELQIRRLRAGVDTVSNLSYGEFSDYVTLDTALYLVQGFLEFSQNQRLQIAPVTLDLRNAGGQALTAAYNGLFTGGIPQQGPAAPLSLEIFSPNQGPSSGVSGTGALQIVHNAPDSALSEIDVYLDGERVMNDLAYKEATDSNFTYGYFRTYAAGNMRMDIVPGDAQDNSNPLVSRNVGLNGDQTLYLIAEGYLPSSDTANLVPNPDSISRAFDLEVRGLNGLPTDQDSGEIGYQFYHGVPDAPSVDFEVDSSSETTYEAIAYREAGPQAGPGGQAALDTIINVDQDHVLDIRTHANDSLAYRFTASPDTLSQAAGSNVMFFVSGFLDAQANAAGNDTVELWMALPNGRTVKFAEAQKQADTTSVAQALSAGSEVKVFPVPADRQLIMGFELRQPKRVQARLYDLQGRRVKAVGPSEVAAGEYRLSMDVSDLAPGVYSYQLQLGNEAKQGKVLISH